MSTLRLSRPLTTEEQARSLEMLAELLASTFEGQVNTADVHRAFTGADASGGDDDDGSWRVRMMRCAHERNAGASSEAAQRDSQEWICPMCETVNWTMDAHKALRKRQGESSCGFLLPVAEPLRCECCGYDGTTAPS
ncbi:hypothetical protein GH5_05876 [Leishmania sp. Ghana 2012 LV757]|uniref:hypothetical protein n=1 Tax=Leishmania sp. Ghana 2012 LV757 TaxID=2803181 RepID=UPI001B47F2C7|nr:hypothetical protein GH5_05876 [Leishmania sp. Ghana 2012 LV757]